MTRPTPTHTALDAILGGGIVPGRIVELFGPTSIGKTRLALDLVAASSERAAIVDGSGEITAAAHDIRRPASLEHALDEIGSLVDSGDYAVVVVDDLDSLALRYQHPQGRSRLLSAALRRLCSRAHRTRTTVVFTTRLKISPVFGRSRTSNALKFYASARVQLRRSENDDGRPTIAMCAVKCTWSAPFKTTEVS